MKLLQGLMFVFITCMAIGLQAQDSREDVVYLKNGSIYRGAIIEQVPGESLKIETIGGNVISIQLSDVIKFAREKKAMPAEPVAPQAPPYGHEGIHGYQGHDMYQDWHHRHGYYGDSSASCSRKEFHYRKKGYFLQGQLMIQAVEGGGRLVNGYKFGQFGYLGIGIGVDMIYEDLKRNTNYSGIYLPLYLHYGGNVLKKRITPFYQIEAGYAIRNIERNNNNGYFNDVFPSSLGGDPSAIGGHGGVMAGLGFGVKFYSRRGPALNICLQADYQRGVNNYESIEITPAGQYITTYYHKSSNIITPGIRIGFGF